MTDETTGFGIIPDPMVVNPLTQQPTASAQRAKEDTYEAQRENEYTLLDEAFATNNTVVDVATSLAIDFGSAPEEGFDATTIPGIFDGIPAQFHKELAATDSTVEAYAKRAYIEEYLQNVDKLSASGWSGIGAQLAAGIVDADALLIPFSGGTILGAKVGTALAKTGVKSSRLTGAAMGATAGAEGALITSAAGAALGTTSSATDIPSALLTGMAFGTTLGGTFGKDTLDPYVQMQAAERAKANYNTARENNFTVATQGSGVGAGQPITPLPGLGKDSVPWYERASTDVNAMNARRTVLGEQDAETTNIESVVGRSAQKVQNWVDKSPIKSLYTELTRMGNIGSKVAYDLLYHPGGMVDGNKPGAGYDALYTQELSVPIQNYHGLAMKFMNRPRDTLKGRITNAFVKKEQYREFDKAVRFEMENRYHDGKGDPNAHPAVKEMADQLDLMHARAVEIQQGRAGETAVAGSENLQPKSGYYSRRWSGEQIRKYKEADIVNALKTAYTKLLPAGSVVDPDIIHSIVKSIVTRSKALDEGIDTNLVGLLRDNGKEFLRSTLKNNHLSDDQIESIITAFVGNAAERSKPGFLKDRIELDMRIPIPGTKDTLLDLLEPDMYKSIHQYTRKVAGTSAMARQGYQLGDITTIREAIKDEMVQNGMDVKDQRIDDILDTAFSYFGAGPVGGGVDPLLLSAMRLTRQSLLGSLGLTQLTELGNIISMVGVEAAMKHFPSELKAAISGKKTPLVQELHDAFIFLDRDHVLYDDELALDIVGKSTIVQSEFADGAHKMLAFGDKIAGYTSMFYQAMTFSQRLALAGVNSKLYSVLSQGALDAGTSRRLLDLGLDEDMANTIQKYINKGVIRFDKAGVYTDVNTKLTTDLTMGFDNWTPKDLQNYKLAMNQFVAKAVQKNLPGENPYWVTKQMGQFVTQLRVFPMLAGQKQFLRNMRHADSTTVGALMWNLAIAGIIYSVSETIKGRGDELSPSKIAKGAINYSPTTGWMPMVTDPLAEIMGLEGLKMNKYGPPGRATDGIIPVPPAIPTLNRVLHLPGAAIGSLDGVDRNEASSLAATPIVGSMYGFSALFNYMKDN